LFLYNSIFAQDYERVDAAILLYPKTVPSVEVLSQYIERDFTTDEDKVRAMYSWLIQNVAYDPEEYEKFNYNFKNYRERNQKEEKTRLKIIQRTVQKGIAVCEGYAMVLEKLCELQGINGYLVRGDTKTNFNDIGRSFNKNHMWNVIYLDEQPYLFDPTWGAGKFRDKFIKEPSYFYYKTPPEQFIKSHYPDVFEDAYLGSPMSREAFSNKPLIIHPDLTFNLVNPEEGVLDSNAYLGHFPIQVKDVEVKNISYTFSHTFGKESFAVEKYELKNGLLSFEIPIELGASWVLIYFDEQPALGYKIK